MLDRTDMLFFTLVLLCLVAGAMMSAESCARWDAAVVGGVAVTTLIIVTGGRDYADRTKVYQTLEDILAAGPVAELWHGGATGADELAHGWASRSCTVVVWPAAWKQLGKGAGPIRNAHMVRAAVAVAKAEGWTPVGVVFPGGRGTRHCKSVMQRAGIRVVEVER